MFGSPLPDVSFEIPDSQMDRSDAGASSEPECYHDIFQESPLRRGQAPATPQSGIFHKPVHATTSYSRRPKLAPLELHPRDDLLVPSSQPYEVDPIRKNEFEAENDEIVPTSQSQDVDYFPMSPRQRKVSSGSSKSQNEVIPTSQTYEEEWPIPSPGTLCKSPATRRKGLPEGIKTFLDRTEKLRHYWEHTPESVVYDNGADFHGSDISPDISPNALNQEMQYVLTLPNIYPCLLRDSRSLEGSRTCLALSWVLRAKPPV